MSEIKKRIINAVKIAKGRTLEVKLKECLEDGTFRNNTLSCDQLYHLDMEVAMNRLKTHLVHICDLRESDYATDLNDHENEALAKICVIGVVISGSSDAEGIVIIGQKQIGDKIFNIITPMTELDGDYQFGSELAEVIESIRFEAHEYLFNGKYAIKQLEIPFEESKDEFEVDKEAQDVAMSVLSNIGDKIINGNRRKKKEKELITSDAEMV